MTAGAFNQRLAAIEEAIKNKGEVNHIVMQGVFLGPARSGKSSLIRRLLKKGLNPTSPSTGAADKVFQVSVKKSSSIATSIFESTWLHLTYGGEALRLMTLAASACASKPVSSDRIATQPSASDNHPVASAASECASKPVNSDRTATQPSASDNHPVASQEMPTSNPSPQQIFEMLSILMES